MKVKRRKAKQRTTMHARALQLAKTFDRELGTFEFIGTTETPVLEYDPKTGEQIRGVLVAEGGRWPGTVPLLADHKRDSGLDVIGSARMHRDGSEWRGIATLADDVIDDYAPIIDSGGLSMSAGFLVGESIDVLPGGMTEVYGRVFRNDEKQVLRLYTEWKGYEMSVVAVPADQGCIIRAANGEDNMVAIHSRNSLSDKLTAPQIGYYFAMRSGADLEHAATMGDGGVVRCRDIGHGVRDAEIAFSRRHHDPRMIFKQLLDSCGIPNSGYDGAGLVGAMFRSFVTREASTFNLVTAMNIAVATVWATVLGRADKASDVFCEAVELPNFKAWPNYRLSATELARIPKGGVAESLTIEGGESGGAQLARYGGRIFVDEVDLVNALTTDGSILPDLLIRQMAQAAMKAETDLVFAAVMNNDGPVQVDGQPLWHSDHGNVTTGDSDDGTLSAVAALIGQQRENGVNLNLRGSAILVPVALERSMRKLVRDVELADGRNTATPTVVSDSRLDNGFINPSTGAKIEGAPSTWYMFATEPGYMIQKYFLKGAREPSIVLDIAAGPGEYGIGFSVKHDVGVGVPTWHGMARVTEEQSS